MAKSTKSASEKMSEATATFVALLRESVIIQGIMTLGVLAVWLYMLLAFQTVPDVLTNIVGVVVGFYFGGKFTQAMARVKEGE
jgi:putative flippase GtrA